MDTFENRVVEQQVGPCRLLVLPTPVEGVVSWRGSFETHPDFAAGHEVLQELTVSLLDKGTRSRDRFALARVLEDRGAQLHLSSDGLRVDASGRALTEDVPEVVAVLAEMLFEPAFDPDEFAKARAQVAAHLQRDMEDTGSQADGELSRHLYAPTHPNYTPRPEASLEALQAAGREDVVRYHAEHFGSNDFILAVAGDVDAEAVAALVEEQFGDWSAHTAPPHHTTDAQPPEAGASTWPISGKQNVDVRLGHGLSVRRRDEGYLPLYVANYVLGGNFSARLMTEIRDEQGLTYGIRSGLPGVGAEHDGHWEVDVTLSQEALEEGVAATRAVVERFAEEGVTEEELAEKKTTVTGSFKVGLSTTAQQARTLLMNAERGFDVDYLDRFPARVEALTLDEVNAAVRGYLHLDRLFTAMAGTLPEAHVEAT